MADVESIVTVEIPAARRVGPHRIVPGKGWARLGDGRAVEVLNTSADHRARVGDKRMIRKALGARWELVTS
jgi:hypothetical protein